MHFWIEIFASTAFALRLPTLLGVPPVWVFADQRTGQAAWLPPPGSPFDANNRYLFDFLAPTRSVGSPTVPNTG